MAPIINPTSHMFGRSFVFFASLSLSFEEITGDEFWKAMPRVMATRDQWQVWKDMQIGNCL